MRYRLTFEGGGEKQLTVRVARKQYINFNGDRPI